MRNTVVLEGVVTAIEPLRHTPAGVAVIDLELQHRSTQEEDHRPVITEFVFRVRGAGAIAQELGAIAVGQRLACRGFLAHPSRLSRQWVLRAKAYQLMDGETKS